MTKFEEIKQHGLTDEQWLHWAHEMGLSRTTAEQWALALVLAGHYGANYKAARAQIKKRRFRSLPEMWSIVAKSLSMTPASLRNLAAAELTQSIADALDCDVEEIFEDLDTPILPPKSKRGKPS